jgi:hypothetical protein
MKIQENLIENLKKEEYPKMGNQRSQQKGVSRWTLKNGGKNQRHFKKRKLRTHSEGRTRNQTNWDTRNSVRNGRKERSRHESMRMGEGKC